MFGRVMRQCSTLVVTRARHPATAAAARATTVGGGSGGAAAELAIGPNDVFSIALLPSGAAATAADDCGGGMRG